MRQEQQRMGRDLMVDGIDSFRNVTPPKIPLVKKPAPVHPDEQKSGSEEESRERSEYSEKKKTEKAPPIYDKSGKEEPLDDHHHFIDLDV